MEIEIGQLVRAIRRWWWVPVVIGLVLGLAGFGAARFMSPPTYTATSQMLVNSQVSGDALIEGSSRTSTYVNLATSGPILDRVILELGLADEEEYDREDLADLIEVEPIGAQIIEVSVTTDDPELAADIANSLTLHLIALSSDLSIGELERNLDEVQRQIDMQRDRLTTIETRLNEIDTDANADDSEVQVEVSQLERERIQISQTLADLERTARTLNADLLTLTDPVVITDQATAPKESEGAVSPLLLALLGVFLGGLIGAAWILWSAFTDRTLRAVEQIVSRPMLARVRRTDLNEDIPETVGVLSAKLSGVSQAKDSSSFAVVSAREANVASDLQLALAKADGEQGPSVIVADSALTDGTSMRNVLKATDAVIVATLNSTSIDDLEELAEVLASANTRVMGTVVVSK